MVVKKTATVGESGSLQANLRRPEIADAINAYRRNAGLPGGTGSLFPSSQSSTVGILQKANWHMFKYLPNENIALASHLLVRLTFGTMKKRLIQE